MMFQSRSLLQDRADSDIEVSLSRADTQAQAAALPAARQAGCSRAPRRATVRPAGAAGDPEAYWKRRRVTLCPARARRSRSVSATVHCALAFCRKPGTVRVGCPGWSRCRDHLQGPEWCRTNRAFKPEFATEHEPPVAQDPSRRGWAQRAAAVHSESVCQSRCPGRRRWPNFARRAFCFFETSHCFQHSAVRARIQQCYSFIMFGLQLP